MCKQHFVDVSQEKREKLVVPEIEIQSCVEPFAEVKGHACILVSKEYCSTLRVYAGRLRRNGKRNLMKAKFSFKNCCGNTALRV